MSNKVVFIHLDYDGCNVLIEALDQYIYDHKESIKFLKDVGKASSYEEYKIDLCQRIYWYILNKKIDAYDK